MRQRCSLEVFVATFVACVVFAAPLSAQSAQGAPSDTGTRAIQKGEEGILLYEQGKWNEALECFREAEALYHSPVFGLYAARALRNAGRYLEAREAFRKMLAEKLDPAAPDLWKQAQRDGTTEIAALEANVPTVVLNVAGGSQATRLTIDERPAVAGVSLELDPGSHRVVAKDGARSVTREFILAAGAREQRITVRFPSPPTPLSRRPLQEPKPQESGPYVPGLVVTGIGGAAILTGGVVGILALNAKANARDGLPVTCVDSKCPKSRQAEVEASIDKGRDLGTAADVLFVSGGIVAAVGIGMLLFAPDDETSVSVLASPRGGAVRVGF